MPIFQADLDAEFEQRNHRNVQQPRLDEPVPLGLRFATGGLRRLSEESLCTDVCEGPLPDSPEIRCSPRPSPNTVPVDRADLIDKLKRENKSPTWNSGRQAQPIPLNPRDDSASRISGSPPRQPGLLPPAEITPERPGSGLSAEERLRDGLNIERPRSALHSGDFTLENSTDTRDKEEAGIRIPRPSSRTNAWIATSPPRDFTTPSINRRPPFSTSFGGSFDDFRATASALASSVSSSFAYQPPTSPLAQSESSEMLNLSIPLSGFELPPDLRANRRHTFNSTPASPFDSPSPRHSLSSRSSFRRESFAAYQAHQPRRSLTSTPSFAQHGSPLTTPAGWRSRRQSFGSDSPSIQHASMVGSYEESILRGRMSTTPSKPLDFLAQIGVLGKGKCRSNLRCPAHVTLPFPAVFYSYSSTPHGRSQSEEGPSPYVGQVDLENGLPNLDDVTRSRKKAQSRRVEHRSTDGFSHEETLATEMDLDQPRPSRSSRRSSSPKAPPGGSYRIPEKGQVQIIIKNQNKTAVKLFLIPYDLTGMQPGTKTFVRQRSYSAGPIIDGVPGASRPVAFDRPILRYLIHLHICSPSKGRFYLYKSIRVVFANRVPDGKEKLQNETTWPEPRYTAYKPVRVMHPPLAASTGLGASLAAEKAMRRRSLGISVGPSSQTFDRMDGLSPAPSPLYEETLPQQALSFSGGAGNTHPIEPVPFRLPGRQRLSSDADDAPTGLGLFSPTSSQASRSSTKDSSGAHESPGAAKYEKLSKGDLGYGGNAFGFSIGSPPGATEGLLSQRLRFLGVQTPMGSAQTRDSDENTDT